MGFMENLDFTYFDIDVNIEANVELEEFVVRFNEVDDGARVYVYNTRFPEGIFPVGQDARLYATPTNADITNFLEIGAINRIVIVQFDNARTDSYLTNVELLVDTFDPNDICSELEVPAIETVYQNAMVDGDQLFFGQAVVSNNEQFRLRTTEDCRLIVEEVRLETCDETGEMGFIVGDEIWSLEDSLSMMVDSVGNCRLDFGNDGICFENGNSDPLWCADTGDNIPVTLKLLDDGRVVICDENGDPIWTSTPEVCVDVDQDGECDVAGALDFDGQNDQVTANFESLGITDEFTISFWINPDRLNIGDQILFDWRGMDGFFTGRIFFGNQLFIDADTPESSVFIGVRDQPLIENDWQHIALTYDGEEFVIYYNGMRVNSAELSGSFINFNQLKLGHFFNQAHFDGQMDEFRLWRRSLSIEEIRATRDCELEGDETDLVIYYDFNQGLLEGNNIEVDLLLDRSGIPQNGQLNNFALRASSSNWVVGLDFLNCAAINEQASIEVRQAIAPLAINVHPNPATDFLQIERSTTNTETIARLLLLDRSGRQIWTTQLETDQQQLTIDLSPFSNGLYYLAYQVDGQTYSKQLIIQR
jgi:hypothetical protein